MATPYPGFKQTTEMGAWWNLDEFRRTDKKHRQDCREKYTKTKKYKRRLQHQCTSCNKRSTEVLRACSLCKAAWYCNRECQVADYKDNHREECAQFVYPPFTHSFLTEPINDLQYPERPVFASGHDKGVGCWLSHHGQIDTSLQSPGHLMRLRPETMDDILTRQARLRTKEGMETAAKYGVFFRNLLSVSLLVQNRRKDKLPIMVFGAKTNVVTNSNFTQEVMKGRTAAEKVSFFKVTEDMTFAILSVAEDPWTQKPRLLIRNVNGIEVKDSEPLPPSIRNVDEGIVILNPGEYVVYQLQYRVGDGDEICKDWEALCRLHLLSIAFSPLDGSESPDSLMTKYAYTNKDSRPKGFLSRLDGEAVIAYYDDFIKKGTKAHVESHYGKERLEIMQGSREMMDHVSRMGIQEMKESGELDWIKQQMRAVGLDDMVNKTEEHMRALNL